MKYFNPGIPNLTLSAFYFISACAFAAWAVVGYHNLSAATSYMVLIGTLCASLSIATIALIARPSNPLMEDLRPTLSPMVQRSLRAFGLLLPLPIIAFSSTVLLCLATTDNTPTQIDYKVAISQMEEQVMGKSLVVEYGRLGPFNMVLEKPPEQIKPVAEVQQKAPTVDFSLYMQDTQRRCKRAWFPPRSHQWNQAKTIFTISQSGEASDIHLSQSCGNELGDQSALKAVENASPFRPLPAGAPSSVQVEMTFTYNVHSH